MIFPDDKGNDNPSPIENLVDLILSAPNAFDKDDVKIREWAISIVQEIFKVQQVANELYPRQERLRELCSGKNQIKKLVDYEMRIQEDIGRGLLSKNMRTDFARFIAESNANKLKGY